MRPRVLSITFACLWLAIVPMSTRAGGADPRGRGVGALVQKRASMK